MSAWKDAERRICRMFGAMRRGPTGRECSDCTDESPLALEVKWGYSAFALRAAWLEQARLHSEREHKPWAIVQGPKGCRVPLVTLELDTLLTIMRDADWLPWEKAA